MVVSGGSGTTVVTDPVTATYTSTLTVAGRETGSYSCVVANSRSSATSQMLLVQGEYGIGTSLVPLIVTGVLPHHLDFMLCQLIVALTDS